MWAGPDLLGCGVDHALAYRGQVLPGQRRAMLRGQRESRLRVQPLKIHRINHSDRMATVCWAAGRLAFRA